MTLRIPKAAAIQIENGLQRYLQEAASINFQRLSTRYGFDGNQQMIDLHDLFILLKEQVGTQVEIPDDKKDLIRTCFQKLLGIASNPTFQGELEMDEKTTERQEAGYYLMTYHPVLTPLKGVMQSLDRQEPQAVLQGGGMGGR